MAGHYINDLIKVVDIMYILLLDLMMIDYGKEIQQM